MRPRYPHIVVSLADLDGDSDALIARTMTALRRAHVPHREIMEFMTEAIGGNFERALIAVMAWVQIEAR